MQPTSTTSGNRPSRTHALAAFLVLGFCTFAPAGCDDEAPCAIELSEEIRPLQACAVGDVCVEVQFCECSTVVNERHVQEFRFLVSGARCGGRGCPVASCVAKSNFRCESGFCTYDSEPPPF